MAKNETKSKAELYREERKARIAKATKQNANNIAKSKQAASIIKKVVAVVLIIAILCGLGIWVNSLTGISKKATTTMTVNGEKVNAVEFMYYYANIYNNLYSTSSQYQQYYGYDPYNFDATLQGMTTDEEGNQISWSEAIKGYVVDAIQQNRALYSEAVKAGITLDDDEKKEIDSQISEIETQAKEYGFSLDAFLSAYYGTGLNEKNFREIANQQAIVEKYQTQKQEEYTESITEKQIKDTYAKDKKNYDYVDVHYYVFAGEALTANADETEKAFKERQKKANEELFAAAQEVADKVTDVESFEDAVKAYEDDKAAKAEAEAAKDAEETKTEETAEAAEDTAAAEEEEKEYTTESVAATYETLKTALNEKAADWIYDAKRAENVNLFKDEENNKAIIVVVDKAPYVCYTVDYYDCVIAYSEDVAEGEAAEAAPAEGTDETAEAAADDAAETTAAVSDKAKTDTLKKAQDIVDKFDGKEKSFITICADNSSNGSDPVENASITTVTDKEARAFLFADTTKNNDTIIIEEDDGVHILYVKKLNKDKIDQYENIKSTLAGDAFTKFSEETLANYPVETNDKAIDKLIKNYVKTISRNASASTES